MIFNRKNCLDYIYAYIAWDVVSCDGKRFDDKCKEYIRIDDIWVHKDWQGIAGYRVINGMIKDIYDHEWTKNCKWVYWNREKYGDRYSKLFKKSTSAIKGRGRNEIIQTAV